MKSIEIYGQEGCAYCVGAVSFCIENDLAWIYRDIANLDHRAEMFRRNPRAATVPQIFIGDELIGGCDDLVSHSINDLQKRISD